MRVNKIERVYRKRLRRAVVTIPDESVRTLVMTSPYKALFGLPGCPVGFIWRPSGPVPVADRPIAEPFLHEMLLLLRTNRSVILISDDRQSRDRAVALLKASLSEERPVVLS